MSQRNRDRDEQQERNSDMYRATTNLQRRRDEADTENGQSENEELPVPGRQDQVPDCVDPDDEIRNAYGKVRAHLVRNDRSVHGLVAKQYRQASQDRA